MLEVIIALSLAILLGNILARDSRNLPARDAVLGDPKYLLA